MLHPQCQKINVKGAASLSTGHLAAWCCTLNALSDGLEVSLSEGVSVRCWTLPVAVARKRRVSSGRGERGHPRPRQREGPDGYEFCGAGRSRHWEGWSRRSRRNRAATTRISAAAGGGPSAGRDGSRPAPASAGQRWKAAGGWRESANELMKVDGIEKSIRSSLLRQGLPEREAVEGDAPRGGGGSCEAAGGRRIFVLYRRVYKRRFPGQKIWSGNPKNGSYLLSHLVGQYHRRW